MASTSTAITPEKDLLPLANRYQAAWAEHCTRVTQRQVVIQMYLTSCLVIFGFWFTSRKPEVDTFLTAAISLLSLSSAALLWMHNRVMQQLSFFMKNCEQFAAQSIDAHGATQGINLFYFLDKTSGKVDGFHWRQRRLHRVVLAGILAATNLLAIAVTWGKITSIISAAAVALLVVSISILFIDLRKDESVS